MSLQFNSGEMPLSPKRVSKRANVRRGCTTRIPRVERGRKDGGSLPSRRYAERATARRIRVRTDLPQRILEGMVQS